MGTRPYGIGLAGFIKSKTGWPLAAGAPLPGTPLPIGGPLTPAPAYAFTICVGPLAFGGKGKFET